jgi:hypothetical protein
VHDVDVAEQAAHHEVLQHRREELRVTRVAGRECDGRLHALHPREGNCSDWVPKQSTRTVCRPSSSAASSRVRYSTCTPAPP